MKPKPRLPGFYDRGPRGFFHRRWIPDKNDTQRGGHDEWTLLGKDREEAERKCHEILAAKSRTREHAGTVEALAAKWLSVYVNARRNAKGAALAEHRVEKYMVPFLGHHMVGKVNANDLLAYRAHLRTYKDPETKRPLSEQTQIHVLSDVRCFCLWAGIPLPRKLLPKAPEVRPRGLTEEQQRLARGVEEPFGLAVRVMIDSGVRWSELCRLRASDVVDGEIVVDGFTGPTKSRKMRRVPIPESLAKELRGHLGKLVRFEAKDDPSFNRSVRLRSGVEEFSAHACRHSYAYNMLALGMNLRVLQLTLGHSTLSMTERYLPSGHELVRREYQRITGAA